MSVSSARFYRRVWPLSKAIYRQLHSRRQTPREWCVLIYCTHKNPLYHIAYGWSNTHNFVYVTLPLRHPFTTYHTRQRHDTDTFANNNTKSARVREEKRVYGWNFDTRRFSTLRKSPYCNYCLGFRVYRLRVYITYSIGIGCNLFLLNT